MDETEELKALLRKNIAISEDTNRMVRNMRRSMLWGRVLRFLWSIAVLIVMILLYHYYLGPYVQRAQQLFQVGQPQSTQSSGLDAQVSKFIRSYMGKQ